MITVAQLAIELVADNKKVNEAIDQTDRKVQEAGKHAEQTGGFFSNLFGTASGMLGAVGIQAGIGGIVSGLTGLFSMNEDLENTTTAFTRLLGSADAAKKEIADLQQSAVDTPLEFKDVSQATQSLLGYNFALKDTKPLITAIGDALASTDHLDPATLQQVVNVFGQMNASVSLHTQDLQQLASVGINAFQLLADGIKPTKKQLDDLVKNGLIKAKDESGYLSGKLQLTAGDMQQLVTDGLIPSKDGIKALTDGIEKNPIYKGGMADQAKTTAGRMSTFKDNVNQALISISSPLFKDFSGLLGKLGDAVANPAFQQFAKTVGVDLAHGVETAVHDVKDIVQWIIQWHEPIMIVAGALTVFFLPAIIKSGVESVIAGGKITGTFIKSIIQTGVEAVTAAGKLWIQAGSFVYSIIKAGVEAVIAGGKIATNFISNLISSGDEAETAATKIDLASAAEQGAGEKADAAAVQLSLFGDEAEIAGTKSDIAAGEMDAAAASEATMGEAAGVAGGEMGLGAMVGPLGLIAAALPFAAQGATDLGNALANWSGAPMANTAEGQRNLASIFKMMGERHDDAGMQQLISLMQGLGQDTDTTKQKIKGMYDEGASDSSQQAFIQHLQTMYYNAKMVGGSLQELTHWLQQIFTAEEQAGIQLGGKGPQKEAHGGVVRHAAGYPVVSPLEMYSILHDEAYGHGELVKLPSGSIVFPHNQSMIMLQQMGAGQSNGDTHYHEGDIYLQGPTTEQMLRELDAQKARQKALVFGGRR